jgi:hypothetical protein
MLTRSWTSGSVCWKVLNATAVRMPAGIGVSGMTGTNEPNPAAAVFFSLTGEAVRDVAIIREFCAQNGVTPAEVMREMLAHRRTARQQGRDQSGPERELVPSKKR